ncbi:retrovirus-related Pol polyprotein from transposon 297 [Trichonephila clavipes]|nr:retrovirus-related Pol polyprotein from transposon 297 [Trichonephila clavipes]
MSQLLMHINAECKRPSFEIGQARFISVLDLTKGYWQISMKDEAKPLTAFVTHSGHYQWKVMPFGMKNAGSTFQKSMDNALLLHRKYCRSYIDDVAIYSTTWNEHLDHIAKFGSGKHSPDPEKVETIRKLSRPTTKSEVRSFLGLTSYYRDYIQNFSQLVLHLTNLTKKEHSEGHSLGRVFHASATAIGACLAQHNDHMEEMPIAFFSKTDFVPNEVVHDRA